MKRFKIGGRWIGDGRPCYVIAEAGSNHNGSLEQALRLVDAAAEAKADAVKFQSFRARTLYPSNGGTVGYLKQLGIRKPVYDLIGELELPAEWVPRLAERAAKRGLHFLSTPFDEEAVDQLDAYVPAFKIASYEMTHLPLIRKALSKGKPLILSTGGAGEAEVRRAVAGVRRARPGAPLALLQCTAKYPAPPESLHLRVICEYRRLFGVPAGLSDHSADPWTAPVAAVALGAALIEKHFTLSRRLPGPDHPFSIEPGELAELVSRVRDAERALGNPRKAPDPVERELRDYRRGVFTTRPVARGERFDRGNTAVLRRAGLKATAWGPERYDKLLGRAAARGLRANHLIAGRDVRTG